MTRHVSDGPLGSVRAELLGPDDDDSWLELGEIQALSADGGDGADGADDDEPVFAQGSDIHHLDAGRSPAEAEVDQALVAYLLDLEATHT